MVKKSHNAQRNLKVSQLKHLEMATNKSASTDECVLTLLQNLSAKFNSLQDDVDVLKEKNAARDSSRSGESASEVDRESHSLSRTWRRNGRVCHNLQLENTWSKASHSPLSHHSCSRSRTGCENLSNGEDEGMDYSVVSFDESSVEPKVRADNSKLVVVSEKTEKITFEKCTRRVPNPELLKKQDQYPFPNMPATTRLILF